MSGGKSPGTLAGGPLPGAWASATCLTEGVGRAPAITVGHSPGSASSPLNAPVLWAQGTARRPQTPDLCWATCCRDRAHSWKQPEREAAVPGCRACHARPVLQRPQARCPPREALRRPGETVGGLDALFPLQCSGGLGGSGVGRGCVGKAGKESGAWSQPPLIPSRERRS